MMPPPWETTVVANSPLRFHAWRTLSEVEAISNSALGPIAQMTWPLGSTLASRISPTTPGTFTALILEARSTVTKLGGTRAIYESRLPQSRWVVATIRPNAACLDTTKEFLSRPAAGSNSRVWTWGGVDPCPAVCVVIQISPWPRTSDRT